MGVELNTVHSHFLSNSSTVCCRFGKGGPLELYEGSKQDGKLIFSDKFMGYDRRVESFVIEGKPSTDTPSAGAKYFSSGLWISSVCAFLLSWLI
jgi:hypothetical protein